MKTCTVEGCANKHHGKGFCKKHYNINILEANTSKCNIENCINLIGKNGAKGLCTKHYHRQKRNGDPLLTNRIRNCASTKEYMNNISKEDLDNYIFKDHAQWSNACKLHYGDKCSQCAWNEVTCDVNHIISKAKGGLNTISNGEVLCPNCHAKKHRRLPIEQRKWLTGEK